MVGREADSLLQLASPGVRRLARPGVDQVEGEAGKGRPRDLDRPERLGHVVQPAEEFEVAIIERLDPERDAVDACRAVAPEPLGLDRGGVRLQRHLGVGRDRPVGRDGIEDARHGRRLHQRWRAPADEDAGHRARSGPVAHRRDFALEGGGEAMLVGRLVPDMGVEVAIGALGRAEGPVQIDAETRIGGDHSAPSLALAKVAKARARCDRPRSPRPASQACFSLDGISPNVMSKPSGWNTGS